MQGVPGCLGGVQGVPGESRGGPEALGRKTAKNTKKPEKRSPDWHTSAKRTDAGHATTVTVGQWPAAAVGERVDACLNLLPLEL